MQRVYRFIGQRYGIIGICFAVSIAAHVLGLAVFGSYKLFRYIYPQDMAFEAVPFAKKAVQLRTIMHKVSLKKPPPQNTKVIRRISVNRLARINLPVMPQRDAVSRKFEVSKNFLDGGNIFGDYHVAENVFGSVKQMDNAFVGKVYALDAGASAIPKHWSGKPLGTIYTRQLNVPVQSFDQGFPGVSDRFEWFGIEYNASFYVATAGVYQWRIMSDDGTIVTIDGNEVLNSNSVHADLEVKAKRTLREGVHKIKVKYFQGPRYGVSLRFWVTPPGGAEAIFNLANFPLPTNKL